LIFTSLTCRLVVGLTALNHTCCCLYAIWLRICYAGSICYLAKQRSSDRKLSLVSDMLHENYDALKLELLLRLNFGFWNMRLVIIYELHIFVYVIAFGYCYAESCNVADVEFSWKSNHIFYLGTDKVNASEVASKFGSFWLTLWNVASLM